MSLKQGSSKFYNNKYISLLIKSEKKFLDSQKWAKRGH